VDLSFLLLLGLNNFTNRNDLKMAHLSWGLVAG